MMQNKPKLAIIGAGGHGKVVAETAALMGCWQEIVFLDDRAGTLREVVGFPVVAGWDALGDTVLADEYDIAVAIGNNAAREHITDQVAALGFALPAIIHPSAIISRSAKIGAGCMILAAAVIQADVYIGRGCIVNTAAAVDHDCLLEDFSHICPGVRLAGNTLVGQLSWVGIGACTRQNLRIGREVVVGAGSVVVRDIADGVKVAGVPAKPLLR
ncbi:acetyltransferase [Neisseria perflava]|uniref:acetyltransferase n=1 Tax=Neisseria perflava TaxID=33053 RepID=UPI00209F3441|nr:acetyltransferase [Neisseria perflava]MCP1659957.1 sugar O-acyltransferase (sialic acid O-acetyltransferase NeuD family) [Neisseria perflava]MCP1773191.1 sugar O-acyltransferase (sialic acid O-acetyltransferase NeuD family) [Neisseria perflava]